MIERIGFGDMASFDLICNGCGETQNFDTDGDFFQAVADAKESGWRIRKDGAEWSHHCPECSESYDN